MIQNYKKVYLIGIGGIGMSALARYFKSIDVEVCGSDRDLDSDVVKGLVAEGIEVYDQKTIDNYNVLKLVYGADCVVYTVAIPPENVELKTAQIHNLPIFTYAEMLGKISEGNFTIAIAGTHGKTTTTAMTAEIAKNLNLRPNVIVGSFLNWEISNGEIFKTNFVSGESDLFIVEACEYKRSFLNLHPNILIITNLEADHLDYYRDLADVQQAFYDLAKKVPENGKIVCDVSDVNLAKITADFKDKIVDYRSVMDSVPEMKVFGEHNVKNGAAAISAVREFLVCKGLSSEAEFGFAEIAAGLKTFRGTWRRMEFKGETGRGALVYDDYGHHPTEIRVTLEAFRQNFPTKKIAVVFQAHLHSRTKMFFDNFVQILKNPDHAIVYPIYRARAEEDYGVSAELLVEKIGSTAEFADSFDVITEKIENNFDENWIVILLGAGEVYKIAEKIKFK